MIKKRSVLAVLVALLALFVVAACSNGSVAKTAEEYLRDANLKNAELENYEMDMEIEMDMALGEEVLEMKMFGTATVFQSPMKLKMVMKTEFDAAEEFPGEEMELVQYMEEVDDTVVLYQNVMGMWHKMTLADPAIIEMMKLDPIDSIDAYLQSIKSAEILAEEKINGQDAVKIEMVLGADMYEEILGQMNAPEMGGILLDESFYAALGDLKALIWVDKKTDDILKVSIDLSENMRSLFKHMASDMELSEEELAELDSLRELSMSMSYVLKNQNNAADFEIPAEAKEAPEMGF